MEATPESVLAFWFGEGPETADEVAARNRRWFGGKQEVDEEIRARFAELPALALQGRLDSWRGAARSSLALVLVLDQFPRNLYRGTAEAFAHDAPAREIALGAIERGFDDELRPIEAVFLYLPLEHAEDIALQERCVSLFDRLKRRAPDDFRVQFESFASYAIRHRDVIRRFGRFPHRNAVLGRPSTKEEQVYLDTGGERF